MKVGQKIKIVRYSVEFNGLLGIITARDGEYFKVKAFLNGNKSLTLHDLYACELEVVK